MLFSIAVIFLCGTAAGGLCRKLHLPPLLGMLVTGILLGPCVLNLMDSRILALSPDLRKMALIIILARAGLSLDLKDLKKIGRPAVLMCFVPACFEIVGMVLLAPPLLGVSVVEAAILGAVVGAVSPAVIVPEMLRLMGQGYGTRKGIPQLILAGASVDDVFVIVLFSAFTGLAQNQGISWSGFAGIPVSIAAGALLGGLLGRILAVFFKRVHLRDTSKVLLLLSIAFLLVTAEDRQVMPIPFSALIAVMGMGIALKRSRPAVAERLSVKFNKLWVAAEILLFVLVGASVDIRYAFSAGAAAVLLLTGVLLFRAAGVWCCLFKTAFSRKERLYCVISYLPKATVQAAIGGVPLAMGLPCGNLVLTVAVLAILITAPAGAFLMNSTYRKLLGPPQPDR